MPFPPKIRAISSSSVMVVGSHLDTKEGAGSIRGYLEGHACVCFLCLVHFVCIPQLGKHLDLQLTCCRYLVDYMARAPELSPVQFENTTNQIKGEGMTSKLNDMGSPRSKPPASPSKRNPCWPEGYIPHPSPIESLEDTHVPRPVDTDPGDAKVCKDCIPRPLEHGVH